MTLLSQRSMTMLYPLTFAPLLKERVWGGRKIGALFTKSLPPDVPIGESWEVSDREGDVSTIDNGPLAGKDLRWLMDHHGSDLFGPGKAFERFPLLIKILDAQTKLSLQVHPPAALAPKWNGQPKTEMWYIVDAAPGAELFVGLRGGVTREQFERRLNDGTVADCFHRVRIQPGDAMFVPSGRVHAIGGGCVLFEVQQNSDTTFRVFDWNRVGLDGKPRALHLAQSLECIDFQDYEPALIASEWQGPSEDRCRPLVRDPLFEVDSRQLGCRRDIELNGQSASILGIIRGELEIKHRGGADVPLAAGRFCLLPWSLGAVTIHASTQTEWLVIRPR